MSYLIGIDLGTSSVKSLIVRFDGKIVSTSSINYSIHTPKKNYAEQDAGDWWSATRTAIKNSIKKTGLKPSEIKGVGLTGQMHGTVLIDKNFEIIRPPIIWCDQRSYKQVKNIYKIIGIENIKDIILNPINVGFQISSILWVKENEPENYKRIFKVLLPKDFIRMKLTGNIATDYTDASGTLLFDNRERKWSEKIIHNLKIEHSFFPKCFESYDIIGYVTEKAEEQTGLRKRTPVVAGCADQPAQLLGNGVIDSRKVLITLGTGGQVVTPVNQPLYDASLRMNTFFNVKNWYIMGALLNVGLAIKWLKEKIIKDFSYTELNSFIGEIPSGSDGLFFLPYLVGERTPHMDPDLKGAFIGLNLKHDFKSLYKAVLEGITFAIKDCLKILEEMNLPIEEIILSGGGSSSREWTQIISDILGEDIYILKKRENSCVGAAMLAAIGCGTVKNIEEACSIFVENNKSIINPISKNKTIYNEYYEKFRELNQYHKHLFK